jgi:hypothetical protein
MYKITDYTKQQADKYNLTVKPSKKKNKKIDVYARGPAVGLSARKDEKLIGSVGSIKQNGKPYNDYPTYIKTKGKSYADERRRLYKQRHSYDKPKHSNGWLAYNLLWVILISKLM